MYHFWHPDTTYVIRHIHPLTIVGNRTTNIKPLEQAGLPMALGNKWVWDTIDFSEPQLCV